MRDFAKYCLEISIDVLRKPREHIKIVNALAHNLETDEKRITCFFFVSHLSKGDKCVLQLFELKIWRKVVYYRNLLENTCVGPRLRNFLL